MAPKTRNKAAMDAEAVARMMAAHDQDESDAPVEVVEAAPKIEPEPAPMVEPEPAAPVIEAESEALPDDEPEFDPGKIDGRTLRKTGREPFATRIKPEAHAALRRIAYTRRITMAEALELAVAAFEKRLKPEGRKPTA